MSAYPPPAECLPGLAPRRLARLVRNSVAECALDLRGQRVLTEAATGPYVVTPVIAALAGADVVAYTASSKYGSVQDVIDATEVLSKVLGVSDRIAVTTERSEDHFGWADIITNSGHVRPIVGNLVDAMRPDAVLPLMFEAWEIRAGRVDVDIEALLRRGIRIAGTNERHPNVDVFSYLGPMAVAQLSDAGVSAYRGRFALLCDNEFRDYIVLGLEGVGASVDVFSSTPQLIESGSQSYEALIVAMTPKGSEALPRVELQRVAHRWPDIVLVQFWGDVDRDACREADISYFPLDPPGQGHMGVLPSRVGPEPIVRIQTGGLKVGEVLRKGPSLVTGEESRYIDEEL